MAIWAQAVATMAAAGLTFRSGIFRVARHQPEGIPYESRVLPWCIAGFLVSPTGPFRGHEKAGYCPDPQPCASQSDHCMGFPGI
jgi:hypothetical protein